MGQTARSTNSADYQYVDRPVAALAKELANRDFVKEHSHPRGQLLHAVAGVMAARTAEGAWIVPPGHALWVPPGVLHAVEMHGAVSMRTVYIRRKEAMTLSQKCRVIAVSPLLREAILALLEEPVLYDERGRGHHLAALIVDEIGRAATAAFGLPLPRDPRLVRICEALIADPALAHDIDTWAGKVGVSRRTLTRHFRLQTGLSFGAWRRRLRSLSARTRAESGESVQRIAHRVGYRSPSALTAMIRREMTAAGSVGAVMIEQRP